MSENLIIGSVTMTVGNKLSSTGACWERYYIHVSQDKQKRASVAITYRGYRFYIDDSDMETKLFSEMVRTLWSVSISASAEQGAAPVLTIPVSR